MKKAILLSMDLIDTCNNNHFYRELLNYIDVSLKENTEDSWNLFIFYSRKVDRLNKAKADFPIKDNKFLKFGTRETVKKFIATNNKSYFIIVSKKDVDFQMAVNNKLLFITPTWTGTIENKANQYGVKVDNPKQLMLFIKTINNQQSWYFKLTLPDNTIVLSLSDARSRGSYPLSSKERDVVEKFNDILKKGSRNYYEMYLYHFLSSISNNNELFNDINYWGFFPSSSGHVDTNEMFLFKERVRYMMKGQPLKHDDYKKYKNLLVRHTRAAKGQFTKKYIRIKNDCIKHFKTIRLNKGYINILKGKNVCIFDDYLTNGSSFESARNLLRKAGVNKLIFVTLGTFKNPYQYQDYNLSGDIYSDSYDYELVERHEIPKSEFKINSEAKNEVENLYKIFNL